MSAAERAVYVFQVTMTLLGGALLAYLVVGNWGRW